MSDEFPFLYGEYSNHVYKFIQRKVQGPILIFANQLFEEIKGLVNPSDFQTLPTTFEFIVDGKRLYIPTMKLNKSKRREGVYINNKKEIESFKQCLQALYFYSYIKLVNLIESDDTSVRIWGQKELDELLKIQTTIFQN